MINWSKYFDHIFCIHYLSKNRIKRHNILVKELKRVGIYDSGIFSFVYDVDSDISNEMYDSVRNKEFGYNKLVDHTKRTTINHYIAFNIANILNYNKILILEDDICFLKDLEQLEKYLNITSEYTNEVVLYDYVKISENNFPITICTLASCYSINKAGIEKMILNLESDHMNIIDEYWATYNTIMHNKKRIVIIDNLIDFVCSPKLIGIHRNDDVYSNYINDINYDEYNDFCHKIE